MPAGMRPVPISTRARLPRGRTCSLAMGVWAPGRGLPVEGLRDTLFCGLQSAGKPGPHSPRGRSQCSTRLPPGPCFPTPGPSEPAVDRSQPPEASWLTGAPAPPRSQRAPRLPTGLGTGHPDVVPGAAQPWRAGKAPVTLPQGPPPCRAACRRLQAPHWGISPRTVWFFFFD